MTIRCPLRNSLAGFALFAAAIPAMSPLAAPRAAAQNQEVQQRLAEVKQSAAMNKQALSHYSWQQQETIAMLPCK